MSTTIDTNFTPKTIDSKQPLVASVKWGRILAYIVLIVFALIYIGPLLMLINTSLKTQPEFMKDATVPALNPNFNNFLEAWKKASFPKYLANSLGYTIFATVI